MPVAKQCEWCKSNFKVKPSHADTRFCGRECWREHRRSSRQPVTCANCGKVVTLKPSLAKVRRHCSEACSLVQRGNSAIVKDGVQHKLCSGPCKQMLPVDAFNKHPLGKFGRETKCRTCRAPEIAAYKMRPGAKERANELNRAHPARYHRAKAWIDANPEKRREYNRRQYYKDHDTRREYERLRSIERHRAHPEKTRARTHRRKARKLAADGAFTGEQFIQKCELWGWCCYLCGSPLSVETAQAEHRKPLARGGSNWIANIAPACGRCNRAKHNKTEAEFRELLKARGVDYAAPHENQANPFRAVNPRRAVPRRLDCTEPA